MITLQQIEAAAPDQASLKAASKLMTPAKWPLLGSHPASGLIWGECQGSGANPYRVMVDTNDLGAKCTCPSRKFPCKHSLSLMWLYAEAGATFEAGDIPEWVSDWVSRRRKTTAQAPPKPPGADDKNITAALEPEKEAESDDKTRARRAASAEKRRDALRKSVDAATHDLEQWIGDQLRAGLSTFRNEATERCRRIAARMVDAKAQSLAGRIDELPARLMVLPAEDQIDAAICELGKLVLLVRAWRAAPDDPELHRAIVGSETREQIIASDTPSIVSDWEVLNDRVTTRRDGLIAQSTWLLNLAPTQNVPAFALLLDHVPASAGRRKAAFSPGEQFRAALSFYPAKKPLRAFIDERHPLETERDWPKPAAGDPLAQIRPQREAAPWGQAVPMLLPSGRIGNAANGSSWWRDETGRSTLPLAQSPDRYAFGSTLSASAGIWDNGRLDLLAAHSGLGRLAFDA